MRDLPFASNDFECVTCQGLLHHLEDIRPCVAELARAHSELADQPAVRIAVRDSQQRLENAPAAP